VATRALGYWVWRDLSWPLGALPDGSAPLINVLGWFGVSAFAGGILAAFRVRSSDLSVPWLILGGHVLLMAGIGGLHGLLGSAVAFVALISLAGVAFYRGRN